MNQATLEEIERLLATLRPQKKESAAKKEKALTKTQLMDRRINQYWKKKYPLG